MPLIRHVLDRVSVIKWPLTVALNMPTVIFQSNKKAMFVYLFHKHKAYERCHMHVGRLGVYVDLTRA